MDLIKELKNGAIITISKKNYTPTSFRYFNNEILYKNKEISGCGWLKHPNNLEEIKKHFEKMQKDNFKIDVELVWK